MLLKTSALLCFLVKSFEYGILIHLKEAMRKHFASFTRLKRFCAPLVFSFGEVPKMLIDTVFG